MTTSRIVFSSARDSFRDLGWPLQPMYLFSGVTMEAEDKANGGSAHGRR